MNSLQLLKVIQSKAYNHWVQLAGQHSWLPQTPSSRTIHNYLQMSGQHVEQIQALGGGFSDTFLLQLVGGRRQIVKVRNNSKEQKIIQKYTDLGIEEFWQFKRWPERSTYEVSAFNALYGGTYKATSYADLIAFDFIEHLGVLSEFLAQKDKFLQYTQQALLALQKNYAKSESDVFADFHCDNVLILTNGQAAFVDFEFVFNPNYFSREEQFLFSILHFFAILNRKYGSYYRQYQAELRKMVVAQLDQRQTQLLRESVAPRANVFFQLAGFDLNSLLSSNL